MEYSNFCLPSQPPYLICGWRWTQSNNNLLSSHISSHQIRAFLNCKRLPNCIGWEYLDYQLTSRGCMVIWFCLLTTTLITYSRPISSRLPVESSLKCKRRDLGTRIKLLSTFVVVYLDSESNEKVFALFPTIKVIILYPLSLLWVRGMRSYKENASDWLNLIKIVYLLETTMLW